MNPEPVMGRTQRQFTGSDALQVAMPLGGIGAGCVCLNGIGGIQDFSIRNKPHITALPDGHSVADAAFALLHLEQKKPVTRLLEGPFPPERIYDQGLQAQGYRKGGHEGLPRFARATFRGEYPFGEVALRDPQIPLAVRVLGWSPLIPRDDHHSSLPCAILEYTFTNRSRRRVNFQFSYHLSHLATGAKTGGVGTRNHVIPNRGVLFTNTESPLSESFGSASLTLIGHRPRIKAMWHRGPAWCYESMTALWREVSTGNFTTNDGSQLPSEDARNGGSILLRVGLKPGESLTCPVLITWHFPNCFQRAGGPPAPAGDPADGCCPTGEPAPAWRPYYAGRWQDARAVADYVAEHFAELRRRTLAFKRALFGSTLPPYVLDAVSANLAILKSPTVLRQENGNLWAWEGCFTGSGCCHGSCTHVWNYAQALPHLFPQLERTLREQELERSMQADGRVTFRAALPDGAASTGYHAAADGQLGGIMKVCRDWQISGDDAWLRRLFPLVQRSLDYCIRTWDPARRGALFEPHHNTYDIEFWGPDGMCTSIYLGALAAFARMARALGEPALARPYEQLAVRGARYMERHLFNGEYFQQKVMYAQLRDQSFAAKIAAVDASSSAELQILKREGPKYQYGQGCLSDGVLGAWMAQIYGIETPLDRAKVRRNLKAIFRHNFRRDLRDHACTQRPGYALGTESALLVCSWPRGGKPTLPFIYCDEVFTGIEYQVASHLIEEGLVNEGLAIVRAVRERYDGHVRNPWNEYECGSYYARAMSSYAVLNSLSGFRYSAVERKLWFAPRLDRRPFRSFFSAAGAFGTITLTRSALRVSVTEGELVVERVCLAAGREQAWGVTIRAGATARLPL